MRGGYRNGSTRFRPAGTRTHGQIRVTSLLFHSETQLNFWTTYCNLSASVPVVKRKEHEVQLVRLKVIAPHHISVTMVGHISLLLLCLTFSMENQLAKSYYLQRSSTRRGPVPRTTSITQIRSETRKEAGYSDVITTQIAFLRKVLPTALLTGFMLGLSDITLSGKRFAAFTVDLIHQIWALTFQNYRAVCLGSQETFDGCDSPHFLTRLL